MATPPVLLPLWPRPGASETLEWLTDVMLPEDATSEERTQLREAPTQALTYTYYVAPSWQARIDNILYGGRTLQWYVPVWPQVQSLGAVAAGSGDLACETRYSEFRALGRALLWESPQHYQVLDVDSVTSDTSLALIGTVADDYADAWLMPLRVGYVAQDPTRQFNGVSSAVQMTYVVEDNDALTVPDPAQYLGLDLYTDPGLLDGGTVTETMTAQFDLYDEGLGIVSYRAPWRFNRPARIHRMMGEDQAGTWAIRQFLHRRQGRLSDFWLPSFEADFRVNQTGAVAATLDVWPDDYTDFAPDRVHVAVETAAGWQARLITATAAVDDTHLRLTLDSTLGGIDAATILRVSFLGRKRLDTDRAEIDYLGGTVSACAVTTVELAP